MKTAIVTFPNNSKEYAFNLVDCVNGHILEAGDKIILPEYGYAVVTVRQVKSREYLSLDYCRGCFYTDCRGSVAIETTTWSPICREGMGGLSLEEARALYRQGGPARQIALCKFTKTQLFPEPQRVCLTEDQKLRQAATEVLQEIANGLNNGWRKTHGNTGYFLNYDPYRCSWDVLCHTSVVYPGVVYFRSKEAAQKAIQAMIPIQRRALRS